jgi:F0F1-type ATP synthase alpha subunit
MTRLVLQCLFYISFSELTTLLKGKITNFYTNFQVDEISRVVSVGDGIARVYGLNEIQAREMVEHDGNILQFSEPCTATRARTRFY